MQRSLLLGTLGLFLLAALAFWPTYISKPLGATDPYTHFHAATGLLWLSLLATQGALIIQHRRTSHRTLGRLSYALAPLFVLSSVLLAHYRLSRMDAVNFEREAYTLYLPVSAAALFTASYLLALLHRRVWPLHARFMACTAVLLVDPVLGRVLGFYVVELPEFWHYQLITFGVELALLFVLSNTIPRATPGRGSFLAFAGVYTAVLLLWFSLPGSQAWLPFARMFRALPLT